MFANTHRNPPLGFFTTEASGLSWLAEAWCHRIIGPGGRSLLIDPAAHGGHREYDLAVSGAKFTTRIRSAHEALQRPSACAASTWARPAGRIRPSVMSRSASALLRADHRDLGLRGW